MRVTLASRGTEIESKSEWLSTLQGLKDAEPLGFPFLEQQPIRVVPGKLCTKSKTRHKAWSPGIPGNGQVVDPARIPATSPTGEPSLWHKVPAAPAGKVGPQLQGPR